MFAAILIFVKTITAQRGKWYYTTSWIGVFVVLIAGFFVTNHLVHEIKSSLSSYPTPFISFASNPTIIILEEPQRENYFKSFPSEHVVFITLLVMALWPVMNKLFALGGVLLMLTVAWARIAVGAHFPADVVGALLMTVPLIFALREVLYMLMRKLLRIKC